MKKSALLLVACMVLVGCAKHPGKKETGYRGIPWGANAATVAKSFNVTSKPASADSLFGSYFRASDPRLVTMLDHGFAMLLTGNSGIKVDGISALKGMSILDEGKSGYGLFLNKKFAMNLSVVPSNGYQHDHSQLIKRYGVIDKKVDYMTNTFEQSYMIMWHNADGVVILAKETYNVTPSHRRISTQIIHMDQHLFHAISGDLRKEAKTG